MILDLLNKEKVQRGQKKHKNIYVRLLIYFLKLVLLSAFVALEVFLFLSLNDKLVEYSELGSFDFLVLFLFIMMVASLISALILSRKLIFNKSDARILLPLPISSGSIIFSKILYVYYKTVLLNLFISTPLLVTYGALNQSIPYFYVFAILYPILISLFVVGAALTFVVPFQYLFNLIKRSDAVQFILATIIVVVLCFIYQYVLNMFLSALNDSSFGGMLSPELVESVHNLRIYLVPTFNLLDMVTGNSFNLGANIGIYVGTSVVLLILGSNLTMIFYTRMNKLDYDKQSKKEQKEKSHKVLSPFKALIKKEFYLLFKDSSYIFSYTSLLIMMPFLSYIVISSLNMIMYDSLKIYMVYFPELINGMNIALILLFMSIINASASLSMTREERSLQIVKYIPVSPLKQIAVKLIMPTLLSSFSLVVSLITLIGFNVISVTVFFVTLLIGLILIVFSNLFGILVDMKNIGKSNSKAALLNSLISLIYPFVILGLIVVFDLVKFNSWATYIIIIVLSSLLLLPILIKFRTRYTSAFRAMEVK